MKNQLLILIVFKYYSIKEILNDFNIFRFSKILNFAETMKTCSEFEPNLRFLTFSQV